MCGLVAVVRSRGLSTTDAEALARMRDCMRHRGPDDATMATYDGWAGLAHRRLSIVDVGGSRQPLENETGDVACIFNGEIYNYRTLRAELVERGHAFRTAGDGEVIVHGYKEWGEGIATRLEGMFAFVLIDRRARTLLGARDRVGIKPLVWAERDGRLIIASEIKAILSHPDIAAEASSEALALGLARMHIPWPYTAFSGVWRLPPGCLLIWNDGGVTLRRFAQDEVAPTARERAPSTAEAEAVLTGAVRRQLVADVPVGAFLSGGIDSTLIVALMRKLGVSPLHTFSIGVDRADDDETAVARATAKRLGTTHHEIRLDGLEFDDVMSLPLIADEPFAEVSVLGVRRLSQAAREHVKVALSGDGGDEVFGGYDSYRMVWAAGVVQRMLGSDVGGRIGRAADGALRHRTWPAGLRRGLRFAVLLGLKPEAALRALATYCWAMGGDAWSRTEALSEKISRVMGGSSGGAVERAMQADRWERLPNAMLAKVDMASMAASLEVRVPLLDDEVIRFARRLPTSALMSPRWGKVLLRHVLERNLPGGPAWHPKRGFALPIDHWLRARRTAERLEAVLREHRRTILDLTGVDALSELCAFRDGKSPYSAGTAAMRLLWLATAGRWAEAYRPGLPTRSQPVPRFA